MKIIIISAHIEENLINNLKNIKCIVEEVPKPLKKSKLEEILNTYYFNKWFFFCIILNVELMFSVDLFYYLCFYFLEL